MGRNRGAKRRGCVSTEPQNKNIKNISSAAAGRDSYGVGRNNRHRHAIPRQITILQFLKTKS